MKKVIPERRKTRILVPLAVVGLLMLILGTIIGRRIARMSEPDVSGGNGPIAIPNTENEKLWVYCNGSVGWARFGKLNPNKVNWSELYLQDGPRK